MGNVLVRKLFCGLGNLWASLCRVQAQVLNSSFARTWDLHYGCYGLNVEYQYTDGILWITVPRIWRTAFLLLYIELRVGGDGG